MTIDNFPPLDALYMTVITITTIGFKEVRPLSPTGTVFTIFLAFLGTGLMLTYVGMLTQLVMEGQVRRIFGRRKVEKAVSRLKNHYILCGAGRIGNLIAEELFKRKSPFVIIERNAEQFNRLLDKGFLVMKGDAADEEVLKLAQIDKAKGILLALASDAETVFTILTARELNSNLYIIARANEVGSEKQITMAGANRVVSPYQEVSGRMVNAVLRPEVLDILELALFNDNLDLSMEGVRVSKNSKILGIPLKDSNFRGNYGAIIVAIKQVDGAFVMGPSGDQVIAAGDVLIVAGTTAQIEKIATDFGGS